MASEEAIYARLSTHAGTAALVGTGDAARVFPDRLPQWTDAIDTALGGPLPAIVFRKVAGESEYHLRGGTGIGTAVVQIDCHATTRAGAAALAEQVRLALHALQGTYGSTGVRSAIAVNAGSVDEGPNDGSDVPVYIASRDYEIVFVEATTSISG